MIFAMLFLTNSTASSSLNAMAAVTWEDVLKLRFSHWSDESQAKVTKVLGEYYSISLLEPLP